ncbi:897_t:CDS:2 [Cetraspora pellucida]|uniref:897_t:CDS:1 n=1 Tax=Cetraspora pellucida TaxID=1433469 RepID=A0A9N8W7W0_9GLOM|nr:897_t:CDS:2 [Cetraspora pellucida]
MFEIQILIKFHENHINNRILYHTEDDIKFTLPSNEYVIDALPVVEYVNEDNMFENSEHKNEPDTFSVVENANDNIFKGKNPKSVSNILTVIRNVKDNIYKSEDLENEPKDSSLKEIYTRQTFTSFKMLKQSKYLPKKKLDLITNKNQELAYIDCRFVLNASYKKQSNLVFVNKFIKKHNHVLKDSNLLQFLLLLHKIPTHIKEEVRFYIQECNLEVTILKQIL